MSGQKKAVPDLPLRNLKRSSLEYIAKVAKANDCTPGDVLRYLRSLSRSRCAGRHLLLVEGVLSR